MRHHKQTLIAAILVLIAAVGMTAAYKNETKNPQEKTKAVGNEKELVGSLYVEQGSAGKKEPAKKAKVQTETKEEGKEKATVVSKTDASKKEVVNDVPEKTREVLSFSSARGLKWPLKGNVILPFSMDQTVYFATLDQYKYNPAILISGEVNDKVRSAAAGEVTKVFDNEETGKSVKIHLGNGYYLIYGQLKDIKVKKGESIQEGQLLGFLTEPTKYFVVEGSHLYLRMEKEGQSINPILYIQD